ncbi:MAG TPA: Hsp70 family protein [Candidatus Hydrogenedentes bacterium]|nr:Hsp70 family protein [Candidatus Hydrogenedentota bacterium]
MFCGVDFGTTNSSVAVSNGERVRILEIDPANDNPTLLPSLLYIARNGERIVGRAAADVYIERNVNREIELKQVDLGISIESYVAAESDKSRDYRPAETDDDAPREAVRARAMIDPNEPGRLFQSLKSSLRHRTFHGTEAFGEHYQVEELTAMILRRAKEAADAVAGKPVDTAVFGRPVRFSEDAEEDAVAERRLRVAAQIAGFKDVVFFYEPVAACVEYAIGAERRQRLMVVDIGGGTCDVCVMEFGGAHGPAARLAESRILGVAGVPVAGDAIDKEIIRAKLFPCFGSRSRYGPSMLPLPQFLFNTIADWQNLYRLNTEENINWLIASEMSSDQPRAVRALRCLIRNNYGYPVAREVELAKKRLSTQLETDIEIRHKDIQIGERLERAEFAHIIEHMLERMLASIEEAEKTAQTQPQEIDYVLTTGGTCLIPAVREMLDARYGSARLLQRETFTSVATGLAIVARYV